jgi:hypothetical protein
LLFIGICFIDFATAFIAFMVFIALAIEAGKS